MPSLYIKYKKALISQYRGRNLITSPLVLRANEQKTEKMPTRSAYINIQSINPEVSFQASPGSLSLYIFHYERDQHVSGSSTESINTDHPISRLIQ